MTITSVRDVPAQALKGRDALKPAWRSAGGYMSGLGNEFASEALTGALPADQQYPQQTPFGLYSEEFSGTAFTAPREDNRRTWFYRLRPSANAGSYAPYSGAPHLRTGPFNEVPPNPNRLRMSPIAWPTEPTDFVDGLITLCGNGEPSAGFGVGIHQYLATKSMDRVFFNSDGEMLIVPQEGGLQIFTECGLLEVDPTEFAVIPRGMRFRVELPEGRARGYICENYGQLVKLPELGPIGSFGLANKRHFMAPAAGFEDVDGPVQVINKYQGGLWITELDHSPLDVVAWHGNHTPYKFDLDLFMSINTVSYDHPDPSINTVMTSHSDTAGTANMDFVVFAPRWLTAEHSFRPPPFHRNVMSEFMGLIHGVYDAKAEGFMPGGVSLHNCMMPHGPDYGTYIKGIQGPQDPHKLENTMAFMFETRAPLRPTRYMLESAALQQNYDDCWAGFPKAGIPPQR